MIIFPASLSHKVHMTSRSSHPTATTPGEAGWAVRLKTAPPSPPGAQSPVSTWRMGPHLWQNTPNSCGFHCFHGLIYWSHLITLGNLAILKGSNFQIQLLMPNNFWVFASHQRVFDITTESGKRPPSTTSSSSRFTYHDATDPSAPTEIASAYHRPIDETIKNL